MPANLPNVTLPAGEWVDLYAATGIAVGAQIVVENVGAAEVYVAVSATQPANDANAYNVLQRQSETLVNSAGDPGAWARSPSVGGKLAVSEVSSRAGFGKQLATINAGDIQVDQPQNGTLGQAAPTVASQVAGQDGAGNLTTITVTVNGVEVTDQLALVELQALVAGQFTDAQLRAQDVAITLDGEEVTLWRGGSQADQLFVGWSGSQQVTVSGAVSVQTQGATRLAVDAAQDGVWSVALDPATLAALETVTVEKGAGWVDPQTDALTDAELRAAPVPVDTGLTQPTTPADTQPISGAVNQGASGAERWLVEDTDSTLEALADQAGPGVLVFTFTSASKPWVYVNTGDPVRVTDGTQTPTASLGIPVPAGSPFPVPTQTGTIRVLAASGQTVTVYGTR